MARLPPKFSAVAFEIRRMLEEGRRGEAQAKAAEYLRAGYSDEIFLRLVADQWVLPQKRKPNAPKKAKPPKWIEIGQRFDELKDEENKKPRHEIITQLREEFSRSERSIDEALAYYNRGKRED